jgi:hypothetical protein
VLIDGGAGLNVLSLHAFLALQIPLGRLSPTKPFLGVSSVPVMPLGRITLPTTFGTADNFRTEYVTYEVAKIRIPYNAVLGRPAMFKFMAVAHIGYLLLKMPGPQGVISIPGDRPDAVEAIEKMLAMTAEDFAAFESGPTLCTVSPDETPESAVGPSIPGTASGPAAPATRGGPTFSGSGAGPSTPRFEKEHHVPTKSVQIGATGGQTTRIGGSLSPK